MMRMSVSVISVYRIGYRYRLILLLNIGYRNNQLIWISVQHYRQGYVRYHERCLGRHVVTARQDESGYNFSRSCCSSKLIKWSCAFVTHVMEYT